MARKFTPRIPKTPDVIIKGSNASEPMEQTVGQDTPRAMSSTGDARKSLEPALIEPVDRPLSGLDAEKLAMMKFMEDMVTVHIHSTTNKEDEKVFEFFNNGRREVFRRNEQKTVKRYFVDMLARAKTTTYSQDTITDHQGVKQIVYQPSTGLRYPFSVVNDPHPRGREWLTSVLAEA
jgi:hypothetical protein